MTEIIELIAHWRLIWIALAIYFAFKFSVSDNVDHKIFYISTSVLTVIATVGYGSMSTPDHSRSWVSFVGMSGLASILLVGWKIFIVYKATKDLEPESVSHPKGDVLEALDRMSGQGREVADLKQVIRNLPDVVVVVDYNHTVFHLSQEACALFEVNESAIIGEDLNMVMPKGHAAHMQGFIESDLRQIRTDVTYGDTSVNLLLRKVKSGDKRFVIAAARPDKTKSERGLASDTLRPPS